VEVRVLPEALRRKLRFYGRAQVFDIGGEAKGSGTKITANKNSLAQTLFEGATKFSLAEQLFGGPVKVPAYL
jgi:hypothetical protein